jgi:ribosome maturation factor RimP
MELAEEIRKLAEVNLSPDKFVVDVVISARKVPGRVLIIIDGDHGITIDDCADLSRIVSKELDERAYFKEGNYQLDVSTPGLDHPLKLKRQNPKNTARTLKVVGKEATLEGKLKGVTDESIILVQETGAGKKKETKEVVIPFSEIDKTFVLVSFK